MTAARTVTIKSCKTEALTPKNAMVEPVLVFALFYKVTVR